MDCGCGCYLFLRYVGAKIQSGERLFPLFVCSAPLFVCFVCLFDRLSRFER
jgi:hypothetical protein